MASGFIKSAMDGKNPTHIAIIMDGNGRWASARGLPRTAGHKQGIEALKRAVRAAGEVGIPYLTLFGFSTENWNRPVEEVRDLMQLLRFYLRSETAELNRNDVRVRVMGDMSAFDEDIRKMIAQAEDVTKDNTAITVTIALNYGGRSDILRAAKRLAETACDRGEMPGDIECENIFAESLFTADMPDPDLLIRTGGEQRISNFMLWQCAYSEFYFTDTLWPDFDAETMKDACNTFAARDRRFGKIKQDKGGV